MGTAPYAGRLQAALNARLRGTGVDVYVDKHGVYFKRGLAAIHVYLPDGDHRVMVLDEDVDQALARAAMRLASEVPKLREKFVAPSKDLVDILRGHLYQDPVG